MSSGGPRGPTRGTDKLDAAVLAEYGTVRRPAPTAPRVGSAAELHELLTYRRQLGDEIVARTAQLRLYHALALRRRATAEIDRLRRERIEIDTLLRATIAKEAVLEAGFGRLTSLPGVGLLVAATLLSELPELGTLNRRKIASLAGLAPFPRDSGERRGHRSITGGRGAVRHALYMAVMVGLRHRLTIAASVQRLRARGKPAKVAITAAMRKLLTILNAMLQTNTTYHAPAD